MAAREGQGLSGGYQGVKVFHDHAAEYDSWFAGSLVYKIELAALQSLQTELSGPKMEIGVGPGRFARDLGVAFGLDPAWAPLRLAQQRKIKCSRGLGEELPFKEGALGTVYLLFTLCFGHKPQRIVAECAIILKDGGHLIIGMIPAASAWGKDLAAKKKAGHKFYAQANFYSIARLRQWLVESNMNVVEFRSTLYQSPGKVVQEETPREALDEQAGFAVIVARRNHV